MFNFLQVADFICDKSIVMFNFLQVADLICDKSIVMFNFLQVADLICDDANSKYTCLGRKYKVCVDKGTYDAISLIPSDEFSARKSYLQTLKSLMTMDSLFIITSCNWTHDQLLEFFGSG